MAPARPSIDLDDSLHFVIAADPPDPTKLRRLDLRIDRHLDEHVASGYGIHPGLGPPHDHADVAWHGDSDRGPILRGLSSVPVEVARR